MCSKVLLPVPLAPTIANISPFRTRKDKFSKSTRSDCPLRKTFLRFSTRSSSADSFIGCTRPPVGSEDSAHPLRRSPCFLLEPRSHGGVPYARLPKLGNQTRIWDSVGATTRIERSKLPSFADCRFSVLLNVWPALRKAARAMENRSDEMRHHWLTAGRQEFAVQDPDQGAGGRRRLRQGKPRRRKSPGRAP